MSPGQTLDFYFYSVHVNLQISDDRVCEHLRRDFSYFLEKRNPTSVTMSIRATVEEPDYTQINKPFAFRTQGARCYGWGDIRFVRYADALCFYDARTNDGSVVSSEVEAVHFYTYYMIIAKVGEFLDFAGLHRIHALGVRLADKTVLLPMPVGGGKTTLCMSIVKKEQAYLYSEDTPLIDCRGTVYPFPLCLALSDKKPEDIPDTCVRVLSDVRFRNKVLVDLDYIQGHVGTSTAVLDEVLFGERGEHAEPRVRDMSKMRFFCYLLVHVIKGKEFPQKKEYVVRFSVSGIRSLVRILFSRIRTACHLFRTVHPRRFIMCSDIEKNVACLYSFLFQEREA